MIIDTSKFGDWELEKLNFLSKQIKSLGIDLKYCDCGVNQHTGYTYIYSEEHNFCLYMPISCGLKQEDVWVIWTNPEDDEEHEIELSDVPDLDSIIDWIDQISEGRE